MPYHLEILEVVMLLLDIFYSNHIQAINRSSRRKLYHGNIRFLIKGTLADVGVIL